MNHIEKLQEINACSESIEWASQYSTAQEAYDACERGDWLLWLHARARSDPRILTRAKCEIARTVLHLVPDGEDRPRIAIETAERWARGEASEGEIRGAYSAAAASSDASDAAYAAAYASAVYFAAYAASAAASAADAASAASNADAADAADAAASADAAAAARLASLKSSAEIVRSHFPTSPL
jgi:hypothetical protein